jgi:hypothetical protein
VDSNKILLVENNSGFKQAVRKERGLSSSKERKRLDKMISTVSCTNTKNNKAKGQVE